MLKHRSHPSPHQHHVAAPRGSKPVRPAIVLLSAVLLVAALLTATASTGSARGAWPAANKSRDDRPANSSSPSTSWSPMASPA
jgi:hypothetical protein